MSDFKKWVSIGRFSDVRHYANKCRPYNAKVLYGAKIKLHGTNAAIRFEDGEVFYQSRRNTITPESDNMGFAAWASNIPMTQPMQNTIVYGEWAGNGIMKNDAITQIEKKKFFVFCVVVGDQVFYYEDETTIKIKEIFSDNEDIHVLPWYGDFRYVNFLDDLSSTKFIENIEKDVARIGENDPYVKEVFGVDGPGEGLVMYPTNATQFGDLAPMLFKVKSESRKVNNTRKERITPQKPEGIDDFLDIFLTDNRFEQMLGEYMEGVALAKNFGQFIKVVMLDVHKESVNEIELADFTWKDVSKHAVPKIKAWYFQKAH